MKYRPMIKPRKNSRIEWNILSTQPYDVFILEDNLDKVNWYWLSQNPNAISILERNLEK